MKKRDYWECQYRFGREYLVPLFREWGAPLFNGNVLDVGCGEGGLLNSLKDYIYKLYGFRSHRRVDNQEGPSGLAKRNI